MSRTILIFLVVFVALTSLAYATVTRTKTMGRVDHWVQDDANIFPWPSTIPRFSDRFLFEVGEGVFTGGYNPVLIGPTFPTGMGGGVLFGLNDTHHLGFFVAANDRADGGGIVDPFFPTGLNLDDFLTLFYGYGSGGDTDIGLNFNVGSSQSETTAPADQVAKQSVGRKDIQGGVTHRLAEDKSIDMAFGFQTTSITDEGPDSTGTHVTFIEDDGFNTITVRARMFWDYTEHFQFIPYIEFARESKGVKQDVDGDGENDAVKEKNTITDMAIGTNYSPHERVQIIFVGGVLLMKSKTTVKDEDTGERVLNHLPYIKGGIEAGIRDWLDLRLGVEKQLVRENIFPTATFDTMVSSRFQGYFGAGLHIGGWTFDMQINPNIFNNGPYFMSGVAETMNHRVTLVRPW